MARQAQHGRQQLRIIGGRWRGRRLSFADVPGLRPSGDRIRETLFNWLQPVLGGARCLDLFAGSGALGLEAASRGAGEVILVEQARPAAAMLTDNIRLLDAAGLVSVRNLDASRYLESTPAPFDIVFLDPPFASDLLEPTCIRLEQGGWLTANPRIYLETDRKRGMPALPANWSILRQQAAGQVCYALATRRDTGDPG